jgi:hypothetical protein
MLTLMRIRNFTPDADLDPASQNNVDTCGSELGCSLTFASEAKFEIEVQILFRLEAKKKPDFHMIHFDAKHQKS